MLSPGIEPRLTVSKTVVLSITLARHECHEASRRGSHRRRTEAAFERTFRTHANDGCRVTEGNRTLTSCFTGKCADRVHHGHRMKRLATVVESRGLIDECDVSHCNRFVFCVHHDLVPSVQDDRLVIRMTHSSSNEHAWVSSLCHPMQMTKFRLTADQSMNATCRIAIDSVSVFIRTWCHPFKTIVLWSEWRTRPRTNTLGFRRCATQCR